MKRRNFVWITLTAVLFLTLSLGTGLAEDHLDVIKARGKLIVGTSADYPPYESVDKDGKFVGLDMDLVREIGKRMGVEVEIKDMGFDTLIAAVQNKKIDLVAAAMQGTTERDKTVDFTIPYNFVKDAFVTSNKANVTMSAPKDAAGHKIGAQTGSIQENWVRDNLVKTGLTPEDHLSLYERVDNAGLDLGAGRIDLLLVQYKPAKDLVNKVKNLKIALVTTETVLAGQCLALPEGETALKAELDGAIEALKKEGWIENKKKEWSID